MNYKRTILMTTLYTMLVLIGITIIASLLMFFVFTKTTADLMYNIGSDKIASKLYYKTYEKTGDIEYCYKALNISISQGYNEKIVGYYEVLIVDDEYADFINSLRSHNEKLDIGLLEKSSLLNEENFLINKYVKALIELGKEGDALVIAVDNFVSYNQWTFKNQGVYALSGFVANNSHIFDDNYDGLDGELIEEMQEYFNNTYEIFVANKNEDSSIDKAYLLALGNRIINVGQDINALYGNDASVSALKESNVIIMIEVNQIIKGLI